MKLSELIAKYGDETVIFQNLDDVTANLSTAKGGGTRATFLTAEPFSIDGFTKLGLIVWLDREKVKAIIEEEKKAKAHDPQA